MVRLQLGRGLILDRKLLRTNDLDQTNGTKGQL